MISTENKIRQEQTNVVPTTSMSDADVKAANERNANTNAFTDAEQTKLAAIEVGATADMTDAEIKAANERNANTNPFTDVDKAKLDAIVTPTTQDNIESALGFHITPVVDEFTWLTGDPQLFTTAKPIHKEIDLTVNGQGLSTAQYSVAVDNLSVTINDTLENNDVVRLVYLKTYEAPNLFEPETTAYFNSLAIANDETVAHKTLTGAQLWDKMDTLIKTAKAEAYWNSITAWHPMLGATAAKHGINVKDPAVDVLNFVGNWTITEDGNTSDAVLGTYAEMGDILQKLPADSFGATVGYSSGGNTSYLIGSGGPGQLDAERFGIINEAGTIKTDFRPSSEGFKVIGAIGTRGVATMARSPLSKELIYFNGAFVSDAAFLVDPIKPTGQDVYYGVRNSFGSEYPSSIRLTSVMYHDGDEVNTAKYNSLVNEWETFLGR